jgi:hypothetical protein
MSQLTRRLVVTGVLALGLVAQAAPAVAQRTPIGPEINDVQPKEVTLQPRQRDILEIFGRRLGQAEGVLVRRGRTVVGDIVAALRCASARTCAIQLTARRDARAATNYALFLTDATQQELIQVPVTVAVLRPPRAERPDRVVTLDGEPGVSLQRSCDGGPYSTDVTLLEPEANGGAVQGTELTWARSDHELCGTGSDKHYKLAICGTSGASECLPNQGLYIAVIIDPDYVGAGRHPLSAADIEEIATETGANPGDTVYWQVRYQYDTNVTIRGDWTAKRPLTFGVEDEEPEPEPDPPGCPNCPAAPVLFQPSAGTVIDAVNKSFSWSETAGAVNWDICFRLPPATTCVRELRRTDNDLTGLSYYEFEEFGLIGREFEWQVRACNAQNQCGGYSAPRTNYAPTGPAERVYPPQSAEASAPGTFIWRAVEGADFYRLIVGHGSAPNHRQRWVETADTSYRFTANDHVELGSPATGTSTWWVRPCWEPGGGVDPVCADSLLAPFESVSNSFVKFRANPSDPGEVSFDAFKDAFKAPSCTRCHAVAAVGLPPGHPGVSGACTGCHGNNLLPEFADNLPVDWHAAPPGTDLRNLNDAQLCARASDPGGVASTPGDHLSRDPLILWAVAGGQLPLGSGNTEEAWPGTLQEWRRLVRDWDVAGRLCQKPS